MHLAEAMAEIGAKRLRSESKVYDFPGNGLYAMSYVADILTAGLGALQIFAGLSQLLLIKHRGELRISGRDIPFVGRALQRGDSGIHLQATKAYIQEVVEELFGLCNGRPVGTTGTSSPTQTEGGTSHLNTERHRIDRTVVGKLLWLAPISPNLSHVSKELSRTLQSLLTTTTPR